MGCDVHMDGRPGNIMPPAMSTTGAEKKKTCWENDPDILFQFGVILWHFQVIWEELLSIKLNLMLTEHLCD